jgi:hypothetical protein
MTGNDGRTPSFIVEIHFAGHNDLQMKTGAIRCRISRGIHAGLRISLVSLGLCFLIAGCSTNKIDWNSRIGNYTYDQAVTELGPPDKSAKLTDGTTVADWMTQRGHSGGSAGFAYGYPYGYYYPGPFYHHYDETYSPDYFIRLTFNPDGKLHSWKRLAR